MSSSYRIDFGTLETDEQELLRQARAAMSRAYNPYSGFFVGAAASTASGGVFAGAAVENASYGLTICAEPAAIMGAYAAGDVEIRTMAVVGGSSPESAGEVVTPCGRCRQMIYEAAEVAGCDIAVLCANADLSKVIKLRISELLPYAFGPAELKVREKIGAFVARAKGGG